MPNVPEACQSLAAEVAALEQADAALRTELTTQVGSDAWASLAKLGQGRKQLEHKRRELEVCELHWSISTSFALAGFPQGVSLSLRRVTMDASSIKVQPAFGAIGNVLSTYIPPPLSPP
jgi:hypothetical protein